MTEKQEQLPNGIVIAIECDDERLDRASRQLMSKAVNSVETTGEFKLVLSSSELLDRFYQQLMVDPDLRGMPQNATQLWKLTDGDDEAFQSIAFHSGMPEENAHQEDAISLSESKSEVSFDCAVLSINDVESITQTFAGSCSMLLVIADDRHKLVESAGLPEHEQLFWFTSTISLRGENL